MRTTDKTSDKLLDDALDFSKVGNNDKNVKIYLEWQNILMIHYQHYLLFN